MKILNNTLLTILLFSFVPAMAQVYGKLDVKGHLLCDKKDKKVISSVTIYRYYHQSKSVELMEQVIVPRSGKFKFELEFDNDYIIDVASNTGIHKRINLNTEVLRAYKYDDQKFEFEVDVQKGDIETPEEVAWIYFDPSMNNFAHTNQMPMALQDK
jgi:hypothetical protein